MRIFFIVWIVVAIGMFVVGSTVGINKGTTDSFMYWWIIGWVVLGLLHLGYYFLRKYIVKAFSR